MYDQRIQTRALQLQAEGPDEFPFGYYYALAAAEFEDVPDAGQE